MRTVIETWGAPWRYWYLHAYVAPMCVAPALKTGKLGKFQPFLFIVFGWSFLLIYRIFADYIPHASGMGSHTFVTLLGIYLFARVAKEHGWFDRIQIPLAIGLVILPLAIFAFVPASGLYNSPIALMFIYSLFAVFKRIKSLGCFEAVVKIIAPSMFGVYLLHCAIVFPGVSSECYGLINYLEEFHVARGMPIFATYFIVALEVFLLSLGVDLIRRTLQKPFKSKFQMFYRKVDGIYEKFCM